MYIVLMNNGDVITPESLSMGTQHAAAVILEVSHHGEVTALKNNFARMFEAIHEKRLTHSSWLLNGSVNADRYTKFRVVTSEGDARQGMVECQMTVRPPTEGRHERQEEIILYGHGDTDELAFQDCIAKLRSWFL